MKSTFYASVLAISVIASANATAALQCQADFSALQSGSFVKVQIEDETLAKVTGTLNVGGDITNFSDAKVLDFNIRSGISFDAPANEITLNPGEQRVALLSTYLNNPEMKSILKLDLAFGPKDVASVRIYDLGGDALTNMFGGSPLVDMRNAKGELLGRFMQGILINICK